MLPAMREAFTDSIILSHHIAIVVPSTVDVDAVADKDLIDKVLKRVKRQMSEWFGGTRTYHNIDGGWISSTSAYIEEDVIICLSNCDEASMIEHSCDVRTLAEWVKSTMSQEAVSVIVDNELIIH